MITTEGTPFPLGPSIFPSTASTPGTIAVNIAIHANLPSLSLVVFPPHNSPTRDPTHVIPFKARTGAVFHVRLHSVPPDVSYCLLSPAAPGRLLSDPRARYLDAPPAGQWMHIEGEEHDPSVSRDDSVRKFLSSHKELCKMGIEYPFRPCRVLPPQNASSFDWQGDKPPKHPYEQLVIYEAHVRALSSAGTFSGAVNKVPYLKWLGINALQLLPVFEFVETEHGALDGDYGLLGEADADKRKGNMWGYAPVSFFSPMARYAEEFGGAAAELKFMVREMHKAGIEVYLDIVFNHTANSSCPLHFLNIQSEYYMSQDKKSFRHCNFSGCGNTLSTNSPLMMEMVLESLRWWVSEYHLDGFRLDAAGILCRDAAGRVLRRPPVLNCIAADPILRDVKLIVEGWDAGDAIGSSNMLLGRFPYGNRFCEWNPAWRDAVRAFVRGDDGSEKPFCKALRGSPELFGEAKRISTKRPLGAAHSVNYVACHDGFSLADVVSYTKRRNRDGYSEISFNSGIEGDTDDESVLALRARQARNLFLSLVISRGVIMIQQGDELGFSKEGNSNTWDNPKLFSMQLTENPKNCERFENLIFFVMHALKMRRKEELLRGIDFFEDLCWLDQQGKPHSSNSHTNKKQAGFVAFWVRSRRRRVGEDCIYVAFNSSADDKMVQLPKDTERQMSWTITMSTCWTGWSETVNIVSLLASEEIKVESKSSVLLRGSFQSRKVAH